MKIMMTGGTGFIGRALAGRLVEEGHEVMVLTRSASSRRNAPPGLTLVQGDPREPGDWQQQAASADGLVNLAGASIFGRWTDQYKETLRQSRLATTKNLVEALSGQDNSGRVLLNASAIGYYGFRGDEDLDESAQGGDDFLAALSRDWEAEARKAEALGVRVVLMRFGVVLDGSGGAMKQMLPPFKLGLGGRLGSGRQWFSWVHLGDLIKAAVFLLENPQASGPFNITASGPVTNREFTKALGRALKRPAILPIPAFIMKLAMGEFATALLNGQKVFPRKLLDMGFDFDYPQIDAALKEILQ